MKKFLIALLTLAMLLGIVGCGQQTAEEPAPSTSTQEAPETSSGDGDTIKVGVVWPQLGSLAWIAYKDYFEIYINEYADERGVKLELLTLASNGDPAQQDSQATDLINSGIDVLMVGPEDSTAVWSCATKAKEAGIGYISFGRELADGAPHEADATFIPDCYSSAYAAAYEVFNKMLADGYAKEDIKWVHIMGALTDENALNYAKGAEDAAAALGIPEPVSVFSSEWNLETCQSKFAAAAQANPDLNMIYAAYEDHGYTCMNTLERMDKWHPYGEEGHVYIATVGGLLDGLHMLRDGYFDGTAIEDEREICKKAAEACVKYALGEEVEDFAYVAKVCTPDTFQEFLDNHMFWSLDYAEEGFEI